MQWCQHEKFGKCLTRSIFWKVNIYMFPAQSVSAINKHDSFSQKNELHETNTNIEFGGKILWKIMQRCRRVIIYKLPNSLQKESRSTHFWPRNCPGQWHFWVSSVSEKEWIVGIVQVTRVFLWVLGCFLSIFTIIFYSFDTVLEVILLIYLS